MNMRFITPLPVTWTGAGIGDVYTMTVKEYLEAPWWKKFG